MCTLDDGHARYLLIGGFEIAVDDVFGLLVVVDFLLRVAVLHGRLAALRHQNQRFLADEALDAILAELLHQPVLLRRRRRVRLVVHRLRLRLRVVDDATLLIRRFDVDATVLKTKKISSVDPSLVKGRKQQMR